MTNSNVLLDIKDLRVHYKVYGGVLRVLDGDPIDRGRRGAQQGGVGPALGSDPSDPRRPHHARDVDPSLFTLPR